VVVDEEDPRGHRSAPSDSPARSGDERASARRIDAERAAPALGAILQVRESAASAAVADARSVVLDDDADDVVARLDGEPDRVGGRRASPRS
jgi:hypothetical protein